MLFGLTPKAQNNFKALHSSMVLCPKALKYESLHKPYIRVTNFESRALGLRIQLEGLWVLRLLVSGVRVSTLGVGFLEVDIQSQVRVGIAV